jgi:signal transduction histidine kinase
MHNIREVVKNVEFFASLSPEEIDSIIDKFQEVQFKKDEIIFEEFTIGDIFYIILEGEVVIYKHLTDTVESKYAELDALKPYSYFGEMSLVDEFPRSASAKTSKDSKLLALKKDDFVVICMKHPKVIFNLIKTVSSRLRNTNQKFVEIIDKLIKESRMAAIGTAASKIVHDIKTPLTIIILTAELIASIHEESEKFTDKIIKQATNLDELVREILDYARGEQSSLSIQKCKPKAIFEDIRSSVEPIAELKHIEIIIENSVDDEVYVDNNKIKRTIINLVKNAIEAIPDNEKIYISSEAKNKKWYITVRDTGEGIPNDLINNIFEPFVTKGKKGGTGLGLAICKKIIEDHNGNLTVENHPNGGACFKIELPIKS